ncbi:MAG: hypothetical protein QNJ14_14155 [Woeseiaceae bacterium]|nr:hypothetical protein [Woeseiaceae bacterium]
MLRRKPKDRVLAQRSTREIADATKRLKTGLSAAVYLYDESSFIICSIAGNTEYGEPIVLGEDASNEDLGRAVCDALLAFKRDNPPGRNTDTLADWAAFQASGAKTGKAFESNSWYVSVRTIRTAIRMSARPRISNNRELTAATTISAGTMHVGIGQALRRAIAGARALRKEGLV